MAKPLNDTKNTSTEPITLSWPSGLQRKARLLAAAKEVSVSKLVVDLVERSIQDELPTLLASFKSESRAEKDPHGY